MEMKLHLNKSDVPIDALLFAGFAKESKDITLNIEWKNETYIEWNNSKINVLSSSDVCRIMARLIDEKEFYGSSIVEKSAVDSWLTFSQGLICSDVAFDHSLTVLNKNLAPITYLVGKRITIADFAVFAALYANKTWNNLLSQSKAPTHVLRWYNCIKTIPSVKTAISALPVDAKKTSENRQSAERTPAGRLQEGKFDDLPGAEMGKVVVRFPPEASGYLHIGHAKAALLNQYYQQAFDGKLIMRFDDTNPAKENLHFEKVILEDIAMLDLKPDLFTHTSQYFDLMLEYCEKMLKDGKAYADDTAAELMKEQREQKFESVNRNNTYEQNYKMWQEMLKGTARGQNCCVRAKIDMQSPNGCMRDPTIYRCKNEIHPRTGSKYKVYPTYDFACPIVDAIEGVTHTLRTMEYHDRDPQFYWFIDALGLRKPFIWEYSRLAMTNTVLSKRKLTWFVEEGLVDGWDDPRMPTVRGVLRRGMTVDGLKQFIIAQGSSRSVVFMEWDKIWAFNKKVIDPIAPRYTALDLNSPVVVNIKGAKEEKLAAALHPKNSDVGTKEFWIGPKVIIEQVDAAALKEGENATFVNWGNLMITKINRENQLIKSVDAEPNLDNKEYKKTVKLTWLAETEKAKFVPTWCVYFDHIISKALLAKDEDFKQYVGHETRKEVEMLGDPEFKKLKEGDIIQVQRKGFFRVDKAYVPPSEFSNVEQPVVLFYIPDGHTKESPFSNVSRDVSSKVVAQKQTSVATSSTSDDNTALGLHEKIIAQGEKVRKLKSIKATKDVVSNEVKILLELKTNFESISGKKWVPEIKLINDSMPQNIAPIAPPKTDEIISNIEKQGNKIRDLKSKGADKAQITNEVKELLSLKSSYKTITGKDWTPNVQATGSNVDVPNKNGATLLKEITEQGNKIRDLKSKGADKAQIAYEVKELLNLKNTYKTVTGKEWKPDVLPSGSNVEVSNKDGATLLKEITEQGNKIRDLKSKGVDKAQITNEVKQLLNLKNTYKTLTGKEWTPDVPASGNNMVSNKDGAALLKDITEKGDKIRKLKGEKADKETVAEEVKKLLALKTSFKSVTGKDWKPGMQLSEENTTSSDAPVILAIAKNDAEPDELTKTITEQGDLVRKLKKEKAPKDQTDAAISKLLALKADYKKITGKDFPAPGGSRTDAKPKEKSVEKAVKQKAQQPKAAKIPVVDESSVKKQTRLGLEAKKEENLSDWYSQVITKGEMIEYYDVSGCYIFRPWSFSIWENIKDWFDAEIKKLGVQNCYFPIFVSKAVLEKEKTHIADFAPEVAWVTKSGDSNMAEPIAVRPTSETVMYPAYAKWIQSYRDLPIKLNQWNNVVRWEFKHPQPFLRTREFLWQEGHSAYADLEEAKDEVSTILDLYAKVYTDLLAVPVIKGKKTEKEKFAGGDYTYTVEAFVSASGRAIQGATSHHLGQNFSKMFEIVYEDPETKEKKFVYQNSWGITTRTIGVMIMVHADNQGLVLPPKVASIQIVIVPCGITVNLAEKDRLDLQSSCDELEAQLKSANIRVKGDYRDNYSPGWKFNHWELKGVPIRIELGPKDVKNNQVVAVRRDNGEKITIKRNSAIKDLIDLLENIQVNLYENALNDMNTHTVTLTDWQQFGPNLDKKNIILAPFCGETSCEDNIKADSTRDDSEADPGAPSMGAKSLCIPLKQPQEIKPNDKCIHPKCNNKPQYFTLFGRSY